MKPKCDIHYSERFVEKLQEQHEKELEEYEEERRRLNDIAYGWKQKVLDLIEESRSLETGYIDENYLKQKLKESK